jgi:hypothetical protein
MVKDNWYSIIATSLPNPSLITEPAKTADMICISKGAPFGGRKLRSLR